MNIAVVVAVVAEQVLVLEVEDNGFVRLLDEVGRAIGHLAVDCRKIGRI